MTIFSGKNAIIRYLSILISFDIFHFIGGCFELGNFPPHRGLHSQVDLVCLAPNLCKTHSFHSRNHIGCIVR